MLLAPAWTREQETDADRLGIDLLVRAGYSPKAMASLLRKQKSFETERAADPNSQSLDQALSAFGIDVQGAASAQTVQVAARTGAAGQGLGALAGAAIGGALSWGSKKLDAAKRSHPKTEERIADSESYVAAEYADSAATPPQVEPWDAAKERDGTVEILENYIAAIEARGELSGGNVAAAGKLAKAGLAGATRSHAYPNYVDAAVQIAQGSTSAALVDYERALSGPEPAGAIYSEASALYLQMGQRDKARQVMEKGYARLQEPPSLTVPLIRTYRSLGAQAEADRIAAQCAMRWPKLQTVCSDAAQGN